MTISKEIAHILKDAESSKPMTWQQAKVLLDLPENSLDVSLLRANAFFPEAGVPDELDMPGYSPESGEGFTTALWQQSREITTVDWRNILIEAGFSHLMDTDGQPGKLLKASSILCM